MGNASWIKALHIARNQTGLDDEAYRALLFGASGVNSSTAITSLEQYQAIMDAFRSLGYVPILGLYQQRWGCSIAQQKTILALWKAVARYQEQDALIAFVKRITHIDNPRFLTKSLAQMVIIALEKMEEESAGGHDVARK
jgi:dihydrodipicolinate synthase/N-acetylneuraminate lyase